MEVIKNCQNLSNLSKIKNLYLQRYNLYNKALPLAETKIKEKGYQLVYLVLYGSQNYNLDIYNDDYMSDFDFKAIIIPSYKEIIRGSSFVSEIIDYEYGQIDVKDIRLWVREVTKGNPVYIEGLFSKYYKCYNIQEHYYDIYFDWFRKDENRNELLKYISVNHINAAIGMMKQKEKALCHPYPSIKHKIEKDGYDGKQSSHIYRLRNLLFNFYEYKYPYESCLLQCGVGCDGIDNTGCKDNCENTKYKIVMNHKLNKLPLDKVKEDVKVWIFEINLIKNRWIKECELKTFNENIKDLYFEQCYKLIEESVENAVRTKDLYSDFDGFKFFKD